LARYSFENFLWEHEAINRACLRHARCGETKDLVAAEMNRVAMHLKKELLHAVALDIAARKSPTPPPVLPDAIEQIALTKFGPDVDPAKISALVASVEVHLDPAEVEAAQEELKEFLMTRCITHVLKGHLVFGVLRRLFIRAAEQESGTKGALSNDALTQILTDIVWRCCPSDDHKQLKRSVRTKTRKLISRYPAQAKAAFAAAH
jgi:hypothetical protein